MSQDERTKLAREVGPYFAIGVQIAATMGLMAWIGYELDKYFESSPAFLLGCLFFGMFAGIYNFLKSVLYLNKKDKIEK